MSKLPELPPLSLYIHIPWCLKKCPYCDFNSHEFADELPEAKYVEALIDDLKADLDYVQKRPLQSVFFGGGTPSLFSPESIHKLLAACKELVGFESDIEITLEANPGTFEQQKFSDFRGAGINRLSIGIQSFQHGMLQKLGRIHDDREALLAPEIAERAGFDNVNLDLMFGLPEQDQQSALADLRQAIALQPAHISWYQLTLEPNTLFYRHPPRLPQTELIERMQESGIEKLADGAYQRYEISAYSREGKQARHNMNYWLFGDYLGIGAGAHGKITLPAQNEIIRTRKTRQPRSYLNRQQAFRVSEQTINAAELPLEFMMNVLRLTAGADASLFESRTGLAYSTISDKLEELRQQGLLQNRDIVTSRKGMDLLNNVLQTFIN